MQIRVSARQTVVSDGDRRLIVEKVDRLGKYLPGMDSADVHFFEERNPRIAEKEVCEVTLAGHGHHVRCKAHGPDHLTAIDRAIEKLENKLHKLKTKLARKPRHRANGTKWANGASELPPDLLDTGVTEDGSVVVDAGYDAEVLETVSSNGSGADVRIVRSKKVEKLTLAPSDAAERMELVGHSFYFFTNVDTGRAAVVYRRDDGDIGLIDETD